MRVSILTATSAWGGLESHAVALAQAARNRGHEVVIVELGHTIYEHHLDQTMGIDVSHIPLSRSLEKLSFTESYKLLKGLRSDVAVFEKGELDSANWKFDLAARVCFERYITIEQLICEAMPPRFSGRLLPGFGLWWYRTFWNRYARSLGPHSIVCVSKAVRSRLVNDYRFSPRKTVTINNGIRTSKFRLDPQLRAAARCIWEIPETDFVFGAVGRLAPVKGYDLAIKAFRVLCSRCRSRKLWLVLVGDGPAKPALQELARQTGLSDSIVFPGPTERPWEIYSGFDVFLMPSRIEGLPHALLEAMATQCPPISSNAGGIAEVIDNPSMGWVISEATEAQFALAMQQALDDGPAKLASMGLRARQRVVSEFELQHLLDQIIELMEIRPGSAKKIPPSQLRDAIGAQER